MTTTQIGFAFVGAFVALVTLISGVRLAASGVQVKFTPITITFVLIFLLLCGVSALAAMDDYKSGIIRRDTWIVGSATVLKQGPGWREIPCSITYSFTPAGAKIPFVTESDLDTRDECNIYGVGKQVKIHYPPGDPSRLRTFLHGDSSSEARVSNATAGFFLMDGIFGLICFAGWRATYGIKHMFFAGVAKPNDG